MCSFIRWSHPFLKSTWARKKQSQQSPHHRGSVSALAVNRGRARTLSHGDSATPWTVARRAPLAWGLPGEATGTQLTVPSPEGLPEPGIKPDFLTSPALAGGFFITSATWEGLLTRVGVANQLPQPPQSSENARQDKIRLPNKSHHHVCSP